MATKKKETPVKILLNKLKPNPSNPRFISKENLEKLKVSLTKHPKLMELRPIIVDKNSLIIAGNMRHKALKELGYKEVPEAWVKRAESLTDEERDYFLLVDNSNFGEYDFEKLKEMEVNLKFDLVDICIELPEIQTEKLVVFPINEEKNNAERNFISQITDIRNNYAKKLKNIPIEKAFIKSEKLIIEILQKDERLIS